MFNVFDLQTQLVAAASPSGGESPCAEVLQKLARPFADEIYCDAMGNLICHKQGKGKRIMLAAHMDAIGFMVTFIDERGFVWFDTIGGHNPLMLINTRITFKNGVCGVIRPIKTAELGNKKSAQVKIGDLYIDIGAKDGKDAKKMLSIGDTATFEGMPRLIGGGNVMGPYADDLISCSMLLMTMEQCQNSPNDLFFVFTVQEEVGCRGSQTAAFGVAPDVGIAVDVCSVGDTPSNVNDHMAVCLGKGPTIKIKDSAAYCSPIARDILKKAARKAGVAYQDEILSAGGTDTGSMQRALDGAHATCISIPTRNIHSPVEIFNVKDVENGAKMLAAALNTEI